MPIAPITKFAVVQHPDGEDLSLVVLPPERKEPATTKPTGLQLQRQILSQSFPLSRTTKKMASTSAVFFVASASLCGAGAALRRSGLSNSSDVSTTSTLIDAVGIASLSAGAMTGLLGCVSSIFALTGLRHDFNNRNNPDYLRSEQLNRVPDPNNLPPFLTIELAEPPISSNAQSSSAAPHGDFVIDIPNDAAHGPR